MKKDSTSEEPDINSEEVKIELVLDEENIPKGHKVNPAWENNEFKGIFFVEFLSYFVLDVLCGPIAWIIYNFIPKGLITAGNLKILTPSGCYPLSKFFIYVLRCYAVFVTFWMKKTWIEFYLLCFTEVSLVILFSTYYSTFRHSEIIKYKTIVNSNKSENDMAEIFTNLIEKSKMHFLRREKLKEEFPEIDFNMFYFYFKTGKQPRLKVEYNGQSYMADKESNHNIDIMERYSDTIIIDGVILTNYIARLCDTQKGFARKAKIAKAISRILVLIKLIVPFIMDIVRLDVTFDNFSDLNYICYSTAMIFFAILIYRSCLIYDTIFLGLISYLFKLKLLSFLHNLLKEEYNSYFYINILIPENITNWYNMRKILTRINQQFYSLVDIVLSYLMLYIVLACIYILVTVFLGIHFSLVDDLLGDKSLKVITDSYKVVIVVVLYYGLKVGYQINEYFDFNRDILTKHKDIINNMLSYKNFYVKTIEYAKTYSNTHDRYLTYLIGIYDLIDAKENLEEFPEKFTQHLERIRDQLQTVIEQLQFEAEMYPHKLLGIQTNEEFVLKLISASSIIGISNAREFLQLKNNNT